MRRRSARDISGVLLIDKAAGLTSNGALQAVRRLFGAAKAGHTGTLDPMATGLLPVCLGEATKFAGMMLDADKAYVARIRLGERTDTGDAEGEIIERRTVATDERTVAGAVARFVGEIEQIPPMYSALKRDGRPLYDYARAGEEVARAPRRVAIHAAVVRDFDGAAFTLDVRCGKGTYIRTLAEDIGAALGCGAHLTALRRTAVATLSIADAHEIDALARLGSAERDRLLLPADALVRHLPEITLEASQAERVRHGQDVNVPGAGLAIGPLRIYAGDMRMRAFLGLGEIRDDGRLYPRRLIAGHALISGL